MAKASLSDVRDWAESYYNKWISVYEFGDHIRITNGSAAHYVDVYLNDGSTFALEGEVYGETVGESCQRNIDTLESRMSRHI